MQVIKDNGRIWVYSWVTGSIPMRYRQMTLREEARQNPEAVINRLILQERWEEAEEIMDEFLEPKENRSP